jgi:hypothetical protein
MLDLGTHADLEFFDLLGQLNLERVLLYAPFARTHGRMAACQLTSCFGHLAFCLPPSSRRR